MPTEINIDPLFPEPDAVREVAGAIARGAVVVYPTDTLYGLGASAHDIAAVTRICRLKGRRHDQPMSVIAADGAQVDRDVGHLSSLGRRLAARWWPGALTLVIDAHTHLAQPCRGAGGSVAVRVPDHAIARALARVARTPLVATSANRSGMAPIARPSELDAAVRRAVDLIVDAGPVAGGAASTIVDARGPTVTLLRAGAVAWDRVLESLS